MLEFKGPPRVVAGTIIAGTTATVLSLVLLYLDVSGRLASWDQNLVVWLDTGLCGVMLAEWFLLLRWSTNRRAFIKARWIDLLASMPLLLMFRPFRIVRLIRLIRLLRGIALMRKVLRPWEQVIDMTLLRTVGLVAAILVLACAVVIMDLERENPNLDEFAEAIWWAVVTASTVGYGDRYPLTVAGQMVAAVLMVVGIGLFGTLAAALTATFLPRRPEITNQDLLDRMDALEARLAELIKKRR